ncbi:SH2 domain-containing protein [Streptomyces cavernicola]|uniref:Uncharacterized protein n=1 Tax=Streptomyces cavernicola TaxID=3043613 RepID=A0ABT6SIZ9_9ACTN|nr:hypothetical protein [Streptomyces sp. B-S-A6]MDI3407869.1 hypothetical protein [Streptomyces sp. B-S-A6]
MAALTLLSVLLTGACMSQQADDINKPLPRKSRADTLAWAKEYTKAMAHYGELKITDDPAPRESFQECVGKNDEVPEDGRYTLLYSAYATLPQDQHIATIRKIRKALEAHGVRITSFSEFPKESEALLYGKNDKDGSFIIADSVNPPGTIRLSVSTPCFLPPGAEQQQF